MTKENLEVRICVWKVHTEMQIESEVENFYDECHSCRGYDVECVNYIGRVVLAVIAEYNKGNKNEV